MQYKSNCKEMFYSLFLDNAERGKQCTYAFFFDIHVTWKVWKNHPSVSTTTPQLSYIWQMYILRLRL